MEEEKYTMAELMAEYDKKEKEEKQKEDQARLDAIEKNKQAKIDARNEERERKHQEYIAEKEKKHQEYLEEKERRENSDETLTCKKCGKEFIWTASEKKFFKEKGFFRPSMCKECKASQKVRVTYHK